MLEPDRRRARPLWLVLAATLAAALGIAPAPNAAALEPPVSTIVILARHGASAFDPAAPRVAEPDPPLSELGRDQAAALAELARAQGVTRLFCSPLLRARQTAEIVSRALDLSPVVVEGFAEFDVGDLNGKDWSQSPYREQLQALLSDPEHKRPGGESFLELEARATAAFRELVASHPGETILIVGHGVINRALIGLARGLSSAAAYALPSQPHTQAYRIEWTGAIPAPKQSLEYDSAD